VLVTDEGRLAYCPVTLPLTEAIYDRNEELFWFQPAPNIIEVRRKGHSSLRFVQMASVYRLTVISDAQGNTIKLHYDDRARLVRLQNALYTVHLRHTKDDRISELYYYETDAINGAKKEQVLAAYRYDEAGNLIEAKDR